MHVDLENSIFLPQTGNTLLATERLKKTLEEKHGKNVQIFPIEYTNPSTFLGKQDKIPDNAYGIGM